MEAFSLLKYWRGGAAGDGRSAGSGITVFNGGENSTKPAALTSTVALSATDTDEDEPFFDLDIAVHQAAIDGQYSREEDSVEESEEEEDEEGAEISSASSNSDANLSRSPSDDLFFKGRLVPIIEPLTDGAGATNLNLKPQFPVYLKKSATKLRIFMRGWKKSKPVSKNGEKIFKPNAPPEDEKTASAAAAKVPVKYLLTREHTSDEDRRFPKEALQRYLKKVKPLYVRVSKRYGQDVRLSSHLTAGKASPAKSELEDGETSTAATVKMQKPGTFPSVLREVSKHLGKTRSTSSAAVAAAPTSSRRDDSLLELQDGIEGAILHCKRSFHLSSSTVTESSAILRSAIDPLPRASTDEEEEECCI